MKVIVTVIQPNAPLKKVEVSEPVEYLIGRVSECNICLAGDGLISRKHAVLEINPPLVRVRDLGSTNGISVNSVLYGGASGLKLDGFIDLQAGDQLMIGKTLIHIETDESISKPGSGGAIHDKSADETEVCPASPNIPGYHMLERLGTGGMGTVFLARVHESGALVAIKTLVNRYLFNERMINTFIREIEVCKMLDHPNIVKFLGSGLTPTKELYLVLDYVNGGNLAEWSMRYPFHKMPLKEAFAMMVQLTDGMAYAHSMNFVHRDIKPHNILIQDNGGGSLQAKLTDLGLAKNFENSGMSGLTASFSGGGTMAYMPPEQLTDFRDVRPSSDVFSLMATFYEMLCGVGPYNFANDQDEIRVVSTCDIIPITDRLDGLPPALVEIIDTGLLADEDKRFQNCGQLLEALRSVKL